MKTLLETWNIKIKVKEVGIKFQKEAEKIHRDRYSSPKRIKTHILHIETRGATDMNATNTFLPYDKF